MTSDFRTLRSVQLRALLDELDAQQSALQDRIDDINAELEARARHTREQEEGGIEDSPCIDLSIHHGPWNA